VVVNTALEHQHARRQRATNVPRRCAVRELVAREHRVVRAHIGHGPAVEQASTAAAAVVWVDVVQRLARDNDHATNAAL